MAETMSITKRESPHDESDDSMELTPDADAGPTNHEQPGQQKRKGGRKPIYATSEERKQRNRQAQAAFRERRTEYIKQLEETIRVHETNLHNLQTGHRSAADECLMLRYKNSLLERILLEKGIDVQAELRAKTGSQSMDSMHMTPNMVQPPTAQRAMINRHNQARRPMSNIAPKLEPGVGPTSHAHLSSNLSPPSRPMPPSHASSPTLNSPVFPNQGVLTPPGSESQLLSNQQRPQSLQKQQLPQGVTSVTAQGSSGQMSTDMKAQGRAVAGSMAGVRPTSYYEPSYQNHLDQLEQEYESQADMVDDQDTTESSGPGPFPQLYGSRMPQDPTQQLVPPVGQSIQQGPQGSENAPGFTSMTELLNPYDPMLDMDPFGLSASMHFPTQFSFDTSSMR